MATVSTPDRTAVTIGAGFAAGVLGGILLDAFLVVANHTSIISVWQFVASALVGPAAFSAQSYAVLGFAMHFAISIVWASIYAGLAIGPLPALARRPIIGGFLYGIIVMVAMTAILALKHVGPAGPPDTGTLIRSFIAHTIFFGIPVAWYVSLALRRARAV
jgi:hypothetical protein